MSRSCRPCVSCVESNSAIYWPALGPLVHSFCRCRKCCVPPQRSWSPTSVVDVFSRWAREEIRKVVMHQAKRNSDPNLFSDADTFVLNRSLRKNCCVIGTTELHWNEMLYTAPHWIHFVWFEDTAVRPTQKRFLIQDLFLRQMQGSSLRLCKIFMFLSLENHACTELRTKL